MKRRNFIKHTATIAPLILAFSPLAAAKRNFLENLLSEKGNKNRVLVLIEQNGGNDGLNTFIPIDKYKILSEARKNILIPEEKILKIKDTDAFGFHPSMPGIRQLYDDKLITIIQGVGYPNPEFSHFRGINIKYTADPEKESRSGWIGRYLEQGYPNYPKGYPQQKTDGPPALRIGVVCPRITQGSEDDLSVGISNLSDFNHFTSGYEDDPVSSNSMGGMNIQAIRSVSNQIKLYAPVIQSFSQKQGNISKLYPENGKNSLADQLKMVAKLIGSGLDTRIYIVTQTGYDTHGEQVEKTDTTQGKHASLLKDLSEAVTAFEDDLHLMGKQDDVLGMTFSEFGRRIASSDSYGTDHGTAETVILFGSKLKNCIIGKSPELPSKVSQDDNLAVQFDFRALYASVLTGWFGLSDSNVSTVITQGANNKLDLFKA